MNDYKDIRSLLKPRRDIKASETFRRKIENDIRGKSHPGLNLKWLWRGLALSVSAAILVFLFVPTRLSAKEILTKAISAIMKSNRIEMKIEIRTESREIFDYFNPKANFVMHDIIVDRNDSTTYWYANKGERTGEKNNTGLYIWIKPYNIGWHYTEHEYNVLGYLNIFLNPEKILESELQYTLSAPEVNYEITKRKGEIILTVHAMPEGDYANPYVLNTSVMESESVRRYVLDAENYHLKSATVAFVVDGQEIEVLKMIEINYNPTFKALPSIPTDITFIEDVGQKSPNGIPGLDARETASVLLNALSTWDTGVLYKFLNPIEAEEVFRPIYEGAKLLDIGKPFHSGSNPHMMFVPYTLRLSNGSIRKMNLVVANYPGNAWSFDGGL